MCVYRPTVGTCDCLCINVCPTQLSVTLIFPVSPPHCLCGCAVLSRCCNRSPKQVYFLRWFQRRFCASVFNKRETKSPSELLVIIAITV